MSAYTALAEFAEVWSDSAVLIDIGGALNCREADTLADLLRAAGHGGAAALLIAAHAYDDDEGDAHYRPLCQAEALSGTGTRLCDEPLDEHGNCPRAGRHVDTLAPL